MVQKASPKLLEMMNEAIAALGSAIIANEECYLLTKLMRGLGVVWLEHQARI